MRVLFVTPYYKPYFGGIERAIDELAKHFLSQAEVEKVGVLTTHWSFPHRYISGLSSFQDDEGVAIFRIASFPKKQVLPVYQVPLAWFHPLSFRSIIRDFQPDVVQLMNDKWFWGNFWATYWADKSARVFSLSLHPLTLKRQWLRPINFFLGRFMDAIHVLTQHEADLASQTYWLAKDKMKIIPWGMHWPLGEEDVLARKDPEKVYLLCVGRLSQHKGQAWLLEVFAQLLSKVKRPTQLLLIGEDEGIGLELQRRIKKLGLDDKVLILGKVSQAELSDWYQRAHIFVLFPHYEAFGLVFLEALAAGLVVVTHRVGALPEIMARRAFLLEPYNQREAVLLLAKLIEDKKWRQSVLRSQRHNLKHNFDWSTTARAFLNVYKQILNEKRRRA